MNPRILSGRRAYEFRRDDIRLTMLTTQPIRELIGEQFHFRVADVGIPNPSFGQVQPTLPPGVVFDYGHVQTTSELIVPIRYLHIEPLRIVIDVAGPSEFIDVIWGKLLDLLMPYRSPDGSFVIGEPERVLDYSEIALDIELDPSSIMPAEFRAALQRAIGGLGEEGLAVVPMLFARAQRPTDEYPGVNVADHRQFQFGLRASSSLEHPTFFSAAPLDTKAHLVYLEDLLGKFGSTGS